MNVQELVNRLLDADPTDQVVIKIGMVCNRDVPVSKIAFRNINGKMYVKIPEVEVNYFD